MFDFNFFGAAEEKQKKSKKEGKKKPKKKKAEDNKSRDVAVSASKTVTSTVNPEDFPRTFGGKLYACMSMIDSISFYAKPTVERINQNLQKARKHEESADRLDVDTAQFRAMDILYSGDKNKKHRVEPVSYTNVDIHMQIRPLPKGWFSARDDNKWLYFFHEQRRLCQWVPPHVPPFANPLLKDSEWITLVDPWSYHYYYFNPREHASQWDTPYSTGLPIKAALDVMRMQFRECSCDCAGIVSNEASSAVDPAGHTVASPSGGYRTLMWWLWLKGEIVETCVYDPSPFTGSWSARHARKPALMYFTDDRSDGSVVQFAYDKAARFIEETFLQDAGLRKDESVRAFWKVWVFKEIHEGRENAQIVTVADAHLPLDWTEIQNPQGTPYYRNKYTGEETFIKPTIDQTALIAQAWEEEVLENQRTRWRNAITGAVSWLPPEGAAPNTNMWNYVWNEKLKRDVWFNPITGQMTEKNPTAEGEDAKKRNLRAFDQVDEDETDLGFCRTNDGQLIKLDH